jgi:hypothetical protein
MQGVEIKAIIKAIKHNVVLLIVIDSLARCQTNKKIGNHRATGRYIARNHKVGMWLFHNPVNVHILQYNQKTSKQWTTLMTANLVNGTCQCA